MNIAIVGGGAAGFFLAIRVKELLPSARVIVFERSGGVLSKVRISGGGRCNLTHSFAHVSDLSQVYPRGARLLKRLFRSFDHRAAYAWFEAHGVPLVTQEDGCVFPRSQSSESVIFCLTHHARMLGVEVCTGVKVKEMFRSGNGFRLDTLSADCPAASETFDAVALTTGGAPRGEGHDFLARLGHAIEPPCPSLFTFNIDHKPLTALTGIVAEKAQTAFAGTKFRTDGALLITHWGVSGPAVLKLSAHAARYLCEHNYRAPLLIAWSGTNNAENVAAELAALQRSAGSRLVGNVRPEYLQTRLWHYLLSRAELSPEKRWSEVGRKSLNRLANVLTADTYAVVGRGTYKDEFVTCGGVSLSSVDASTLESRSMPGLFFAGEMLDIDGVTGGFNLTAAWTTAHTAAEGIARRLSAPSDGR